MARQRTKEDLAKLVGSNIKRLRQSKGLSQEELAEMLFLSKNYISLLETGAKFPSAETLVKLSAALDVDCCVFFTDGSLIAKEVGRQVTMIIQSSVKEELDKILDPKDKQGNISR